MAATTISPAGFPPLTEPQQARAISTLVLAFASDPVIRWMYPEPEQYLTQFPRFLRAFGGKAFAAGTVWSLEDYSAAALWLPPDVYPDGEAILAQIEQSLPPDRLGEMLPVIEQMDRAHPGYPHWYLPWFGVDGALQCRGLGSELMRRCLEVVDADHLPAYLESPNPRNLSFYGRHGFEVVGEARAGSCPPVYFMLREAR